MVGTNTALADNPGLTTRLWPGKDPLRVVLDLKGRLPKSLKMFTDGKPTLVLRNGPDSVDGPLRYRHVDASADLVKTILDILYAEGIQSLIVEGGAQLLNTFLSAGAWDEIRQFVSPKVAGNKGVPAPSLPVFTSASTKRLEDDELTTLIRESANSPIR